MAPKKKAAAKSKAKAATKKKAPPPKKKAQPQKKKAPPPSKFLTCGETGDRIFVSTATLADIQKPPTNQGKRKVLYKVPSAKTRNTLYDELALCLEDCESRRLPKYGGRPWQVICRVTDNTTGCSGKSQKQHNTKSPFFRFMRGKLELAVLPHLLEKIPQPPKFPGYIQTDQGVVRQVVESATEDGAKKKSDEDEEQYDLTEEESKRMETLLSREITSVSQVAWDHRNDTRLGAPTPTVTLKWICPLRQIFSSRKQAWDHAVELAKAEQCVDRYLKGLGKNGALLKPFKPTRTQALQAGKVRFLRDGLWVVGQEQEWQNERFLSIEREEQRKEEEAEQQQQLVASNKVAKTEAEQSVAAAAAADDPPLKKRRKITGSSLFLLLHRVAHKEHRIGELKQQQQQQDNNEEAVEESKPPAAAAAINPASNKRKSKIAEKVGMPILSAPPKKKKQPVKRHVHFSLTAAERELRGIWRDELTQEERTKWDARANASFQRKIDEDDKKRWDLAEKLEAEEETDDEEDDSSSDSDEEEEDDSGDDEDENGESNGEEEEEKASTDHGKKKGTEKAKEKATGDDSDDDDDAAMELIKLASEHDRACWEMLSHQEQELWKKGAPTTVASFGEEKKPAATKTQTQLFPRYDSYHRRVYRAYWDETPEEYREHTLSGMRVMDRRRELAENQKQKDMLAQGLKNVTVGASEALEKGIEKWLTLGIQGRNRSIKAAKQRAEKKAAAAVAAAANNDTTKSSNKSASPSVGSTGQEAAADPPSPKSDEEVELKTILPEAAATNTALTSQRESSSTPISPSPPLVNPIDNQSNADGSRQDAPPKPEDSDLQSTGQDNSASSMEGSSQKDSDNDDGEEEEDQSASEPEEEEEEEEVPRFVPNRLFCLTEHQVKLCLDASLEHFDAVMRTVKAKDLTRELADGFDVLRERGRGRYDMELTAFDTKEFDFLNDITKTPWVEVVREVLGHDIVLIHKGCFLSLPDAANQVYHQDGVHLHNSSQRDCHAVNVFIPLVDMTMQHGPTEFCLGSHILGQEDWDKRFISTPLQKKGVPVMFDYRLGHRGLANTSKDPRPIVYCTYARAGDGDGDAKFRDSVNFSNRRYRKLGDLVDKPMSREERNKKRSEKRDEEMWEEFPEAFAAPK